MEVYNLTKTGLEDVKRVPFESEKDIQSLVESNLRILFNLQFVKSEFTIGDFRIDTLAYDEESSSFVIVEYKRGHSYSVIDQGYSYLSSMLDNKADFILEYNEQTGDTLKRQDVDWSQSKVIFVAPSFNTYQKNSVNFRDVPFELWEIKRFSGGLIVLEQNQSNSKVSIEDVGSPTSVISKVSAEVTVSNESELLVKSESAVHEIWEAIREYSLEFGDTKLVPGKNHISIKKGNRSVCYVDFRKKHLTLGCNRGNTSPEGKKSKDFFSFEDPKGIANDSSFTWKSGWKGHRYSVKVSSANDVEYVKWLIKQRYDSLK